MATATAFSNATSLNSLRRFPRIWLYVVLAFISFFLFHQIVIQRQDVLPSISAMMGSDAMSNREPIAIKPGDLGHNLLEVRPQDDKSPFAHEPVGLGTLRDVREDNFYRGGVLALNPGSDKAPSPVILDPYPDYNGKEWRDTFAGSFRACEGPRRNTLNRRNPEDMMTVYPGIQTDFPPSLIGSYSALQLDASVCTSRHSRLGAYGYESDSNDSSNVWLPPKTDWDSVPWGRLQSQCLDRNADRYVGGQANLQAVHSLPTRPTQEIPSSQSETGNPHHKTRSAVILRAWHDMEWTENLKQSIRALIMELSLHSGGEYEVIILCHVKDRKININLEGADALNLKAQFVPREFLDMTILFNDFTLESWYPKVEEHSTIIQYWQPVQILSQTVQGYDYFWQFEMDSRFTGHAYHFLERVAEFAKAQPRKYLWERNSYFYIPGAYGIWEQFKHMVSTSLTGKESIWGPMDLSNIIAEGSVNTEPMVPVGPKPPVVSPKTDKYEWGVGEESDLITFLPIFDPIRTAWVFTNHKWGVKDDVPRRASPVAIGRISKTLVQQMHNMQSKWGIALASEMTAPTVALWHGLKAVHVPHPIFADGKWTSRELGRIMNPGPAEKINGGEDSIWNWDHHWDHILYRLTYLFSTLPSENLYRRWLGFKVDPDQYIDGTFHQDPQGRNWFETGDLREDLYGPLCFPSMLLHPVKNTEAIKGKGMAVPV
ncbi:hypothetical protein N7466_009698 [Penicillium verhagenii]|uniref:uncharacterized protein n=1 Tax=Penicillium verhagenii TaxID=1562060 RepID=UPI0025456656|nr:uncharacterized protein N7466_009698 [Penicillium verhagenii]KAJ5921372.1 hypothetical protein N7466_009698 [Penicillium verhagenii]